jgi:3-hydroxybutyryl-CoA dehydratase
VHAVELRTIDSINIGDKANFTKTISETDIYLFAGITGDLNPAHVNSEYAKTTFFKERIAHAQLTVGLLSTVIGMQLPGPGTIIVRQDIGFKAPVYIGDTITAEIEVIEKEADRNRLKLRGSCTNQKGTIVASGEFTVSPYVREKK